MRWLGFDWGDRLHHASDYFEQLYEWAEHLIRAGKAYVDDQSQDEIRAARGTLTEPGRDSPFRDRGVAEISTCSGRMRAGEFPDGARVLRAKIDMASGNINLRDPVMYRILNAPHPRTGTDLAHLSELRLRPRPVRRHRGRDPFAVHAGICRSPAALRLVHRQSAGAGAAASIRIRPPQSQPHGPVQARADRAGPGRPCDWLGRSAHADARRPSPPRRAAGSHPRFRAAHRASLPRRQPRGRAGSRFFHSRNLEQGRGAPHGGAPPAQGRHRELSGRPDRGTRGGEQPGGSVRRFTAGALRPRDLRRARRLHGRPAEEILPPVAGAGGASALRLFHQMRRRGGRTPRGR